MWDPEGLKYIMRTLLDSGPYYVVPVRRLKAGEKMAVRTPLPLPPPLPTKTRLPSALRALGIFPKKPTPPPPPVLATGGWVELFERKPIRFVLAPDERSIVNAEAIGWDVTSSVHIESLLIVGERTGTLFATPQDKVVLPGVRIGIAPGAISARID